MGAQLLLDKESRHPTLALWLSNKEKGRGQPLLSAKLPVCSKAREREIPAEGDLSKIQVFCVGVWVYVLCVFQFSLQRLSISDSWKQG